MAYHPVHHYYTYCDDNFGYGGSSPEEPLPPGTPQPGTGDPLPPLPPEYNNRYGYGYHSPLGWGRGPLLQQRLPVARNATEDQRLVEALPG